MVTWTIFKNHIFGGGLNTKSRDQCSQPLIYSILACGGQAWIDIHCNGIWLRAQSHMISHYTWGSMSTLHDVGGGLGWPLKPSFWGSHNFMVTAFGSCVKTCWVWFEVLSFIFGLSPLQTRFGLTGVLVGHDTKSLFLFLFCLFISLFRGFLAMILHLDLKVQNSLESTTLMCNFWQKSGLFWVSMLLLLWYFRSKVLEP